ncbi:MAG: formate/nitrite transporter family protein [Spirochaetes bacterium]|nr:formate/nitrite transporter family protein [Spirochaetota bacterium]
MIDIGYNILGEAAKKKVHFYNNAKTAYFISSVLAGVYVGVCMILILAMAGLFGDFAGLKILQGASFAAALSLVVFAGAELFTGNVFVMTAGLCLKTVKPKDAIGLCAYCYLGNLAGSIFIAALFLGTGYLQGKVVYEAAIAIYAKTDPAFIALFFRGILCNLLVCAAVWIVYRMHSESGKLIIIFWCIYLFVVSGFEHSIANMSLFSLGAMAGSGLIAIPPMLINLAATTVGNIVGGVLLALAYWAIARKTS